MGRARGLASATGSRLASFERSTFARRYADMPVGSLPSKHRPHPSGGLAVATNRGPGLVEVLT